jgi:hypothetical protein
VAVGNVDFVEAMAVLREMLLGRWCQDNRFDWKGQLGWAMDSQLGPTRNRARSVGCVREISQSRCRVDRRTKIGGLL